MPTFFDLIFIIKMHELCLKLCENLKRCDISIRMFKTCVLGKSHFCVQLSGYGSIANVDRIK